MKIENKELPLLFCGNRLDKNRPNGVVSVKSVLTNMMVCRGEERGKVLSMMQHSKTTALCALLGYSGHAQRCSHGCSFHGKKEQWTGR
jgi:hypothetical protein